MGEESVKERALSMQSHEDSMQSHEDDGRLPTRRVFLGLTTVGMVIAATPVVATTTSIENGLQCAPRDALADPLDALLSRYGSEFGEITKVC